MSKEINLLPLVRQRQIARRFFMHSIRRLLTSFMLGLLLVTIVALVTLVGLSVAAPLAFPGVGKELEAAVLDFRTEIREIRERNVLIEEMNALHQGRITWSGYLPQVLRTLPPGTELLRLSGDVAERTLFIQGKAQARSGLLILEDRLRTLPWAMSVEAPVTNLLERVSPEFTFFVKL